MGFTTADDRQKVSAFVRRNKRSGSCATELDDFDFKTLRVSKKSATPVLILE